MKNIILLSIAVMMSGCEKKRDEPWVDYAVDAQRWRECQRELPDHSGNYLVFLTRTMDSSSVSHMKIMWYSKWDNGAFPSKWNTESLENEGYTVRVRYWQRLPQEPIVE